MERREIACVELCLLSRLMVGLCGDRWINTKDFCSDTWRQKMKVLGETRPAMYV